MMNLGSLETSPTTSLLAARLRASSVVSESDQKPRAGSLSESNAPDFSRLGAGLKVMNAPVPSQEINLNSGVVIPFDWEVELESILGQCSVLSSGADILVAAAQANTKEAKHLVHQIGLLQVSMDMLSSDVEVDLTGLSNQDKNEAERMADTLKGRDYNAETKRWTSDSGLKVGLPCVLSTMKSERHTLLRANRPMEYSVGNFGGVGKGYADTVNLSNPKADWIREKYAVAPEGELRSREGLRQELLSQPEMWVDASNHIMDQARTSGARPDMVVYTAPENANDWLATVSFEGGELHVSIPEKAIEFMQQKVVTQDGPGAKLDGRDDLKFLFTHDLGGNIKVGPHWDTVTHHSTPDGGRPLRTAGMLFGKLVQSQDGTYKLHASKVKNDSGHYQPSVGTAVDLRNTLVASGMSPDAIAWDVFCDESRKPGVIAGLNSEVAMYQAPEGLDHSVEQHVGRIVDEYTTLRDAVTPHRLAA